jgi:beta-lactam-binding protein with PASTA domain
MNKLKFFFREFKELASTAAFWTEIAKMFGILFFLFIAIFWVILPIYTHHGESVTVPNLIGKELTTVRKELRSKNLNYQVVDSVYTPDKIANTIIDQTPKAASRVKESRIIYLTINSSIPPNVKFPDIWGRDFDQAKRYLDFSKIKIGNVEYKPDKARNTVLQVKYNGKVIPRPDKAKNIPPFEIPMSAIVDLVVAQSEATDVELPNLRCKTYDAAVFQLHSYKLNVGAVILDKTVSDTAQAFIWRQQPEFAPGKRVELGDDIDIFLTAKNPCGAEQQVPALPPGSATETPQPTGNTTGTEGTDN